MSTSALASARRRRATNEVTLAPNMASTNVARPVQQVQKDIPREQTQSLTPLQILQIHDIKIKELEILINEFTDDDILSKFIDEKMEGLVSSNNGTTSTNSLYDEKLQMVDKNIAQKIELQNSKIDEFKASIREIINSIKEDNNNVMKYINSNIQNQITTNNNLLNNKFTNLDAITCEISELKLLVIKSQTMALETSNSINKLYEQCNTNSVTLKAHEEKFTQLNTKKNDMTSNIMLQSLLTGSLFKPNDLNSFNFHDRSNHECDDCDDCNDCDENINLAEIKKLNIDFDNNELLLNDEQIEDLLHTNISIHEIIDETITEPTEPTETTETTEPTEPTETPVTTEPTETPETPETPVTTEPTETPETPVTTETPE